MAIFYDQDADPTLLTGRRVAVLGFGAQGRAQALNLRDSGVEVVVGLRADSRSRAAAAAAGLATATPAEAVRSADVAVMLVPDPAQPALYAEAVAPNLRAGGALVFAHGYNIRFGYITPRDDLDVVMVAPLGIGEQVRATYLRGAGVPALLAVERDATGMARARALAYARACGHGRAGIIETTFAAETETDLFAEQVVLCGGLTHLVEAAFDTLVEAGYDPDIAYFCCLHEVKLIADLVQARGITGMRRSISPVAEYGDATRGPRVIDEHVRAEMRRILEEIRSGAFARELEAEIRAGSPVVARERERMRAHLIERVGERLRAMMPWLARDGEGR
ncbi:MAG TPA: ketol-acid reductoisomerase [Gammaproteobacteria bacterium]|nr:ketol-acid reductoisomerase [Gammaproteobacteria bacterium]